MGVLKFSRQEYDFTDRLLMHLQTAITGKLLRRESFAMSWGGPEMPGGLLTTVWVAPSAPIEFFYASDDIESINTSWVSALEWSAGRPGGMQVMSEEAAGNFAIRHASTEEQCVHSNHAMSESSSSLNPS